MDNNSTTIVFYKDYMDYYEIYSPFPHQDPKQVEDKIKREMMKKAGYSDDEIDMYSDIFDLQYDGADGFEDNPYTAVSLVKIIDRESPGAGPKSPPPEEKIKEPPQDPRQTMLQQYYGDRKAEANRRKKFARFKSHIIQKPIKTYDKDGNSKTIEVYTIEDYPEKEADTDELLLYGYATRLERLSRAHQGDFSPYEAEYYRRLDDVKTEIYSNYYEKVEKSRSEAEKFKKEHLKELENLSSEESIKKGIQVLIEKDTEFIETNNYGYNSHQNTQENLRTLGKYGEKSVKAPISVDQSVATKFLLHSMNALIEIRNHTIAPIHQAVGTFVASPIHRLLTGTKRVTSEPVNVNGYYITPMKDMIATSQRNSVGMFKNKITHRYQARKDYFTQKISREEQERLMSTEKGYNINSVKRTSPRTLLKLAVLPRLMAVFNYKQGNAAVLNAGLYDIELATERRNKELSWKRDELLSLRGKIIRSKRILEDLEKIQSINKDNDPKKIEEIQKAIDYKRTQIAVYTGKFMERSRVEVDSIQTDALSMSQHDKANKSDIDKTVQVAKTAGRIAIARAISKYLYKTIAQKRF